jgi:predicted PurR-regulated permease PerM
MQDDHQANLSSLEEQPDLLSIKRSAFWHLWKRRALLLVALLILLVPLYGTFEPLFEFILFAVSLATLTFPIFFVPIKRYLGKLLPRMNEQRLAEICAVLSTLSLLLVLLSPLLLLLWDASGEKQGLIEVVWSLALGEESAKNTLLRGVSEQIRQIQTIFPRLPIDEIKALEFVANLVGDTREFSGTFIEFLFKGTRGFVAELALALIALSFLYAHGGNFVRNALKAGGFSNQETSSWFTLYRMITLRLLNDTVLTSLIRGIAMGLVAHFIGGFVFLPIFLIGAFVGLVPVVGSAMVWLPISSIIWGRGEPVTAVTVAGLCILLNHLISRARAGMGKRLHDQGAWLSFMLFLGIIGGILAYGPQGFVIGPMAVVLAYGLVRFLGEQSVGKNLPQDQRK